MTDILTDILVALDAPQFRYAELDRYFNGVQDMAFLAPEAKAALGSRFGRMVSNIPRLAITSVSERLRVSGFSLPEVWDDFTDNGLDVLSRVVHNEALLLGASYLCVWANPDGSPRVSVESARQVTVLADPGSREITAAVKRWRDKVSTHAVLYLPDSIQFYTAQTPGATTAGFNPVGDPIPNPFGRVPIVQFRNADRIPVGGVAFPERLLEYGHSEIFDLIPLVDGLNKILADMLVTSEYVGRPRRFASGIELVKAPKLDCNGAPVLNPVTSDPEVETVNPIPDSNRMMVSENENAKWGQLPAADLAGYEAAVRVLVSQIQAVSALPSAYLGVLTAQPPSADGIRAAEASLVARAESKQQSFSKSWEETAQLIAAVRDGVNPSTVDVQVQWAPADTRSQAEEADSAVKLYSAGILSRETTLRRLGMSDDEVAMELRQHAGDMQMKADSNINSYINAITTDRGPVA